MEGLYVKHMGDKMIISTKLQKRPNFDPHVLFRDLFPKYFWSILHQVIVNVILEQPLELIHVSEVADYCFLRKNLFCIII